MPYFTPMWGKVGGYWSNSSQGGLFSLHSFNEVYQEQYTVQEITGYKGSWPSNRRCGYIFMRFDRSDGLKQYYYGLTDGEYKTCNNTMNGKSYCSKMSQEVFDIYSAICGYWVMSRPWADNLCSKGWGKNKGRHPNDYYSTWNSQGYINDGTGNPIYSTVTKYRDAVYNYITTRVAKA